MVSAPRRHTWKSPLDGTDVASVDITEPSEVPQVVARARDAFTSWSATTLESRGRIIRRAAQILESRAEDLATIVRRETGKPLSGALDRKSVV